MNIFLIVLGIVIIKSIGYFKNKVTNDKNSNVFINYLKSDFAIDIVTKCGLWFIISGILNIMVANSMFKLYGFILSVGVPLIFALKFLNGFLKYRNA
ncbi:hypothetical protein [Romboutsia lituseburensis]|uniref:hypothetical protein n=1 Tax=Romboutsia lituseburensis TaxID=1537 RepID=UPI00215ABD2D|nr:hypothetical protein [Romboutsia lituseburensis]MCR8747106.1 hypothetical protein [Romboutsia lituseburensis]